MSGSSNERYRNTDLDPDLLSRPFQAQTNWHVITGASCSGKSTMIELLAQEGFQTIPETARQFIESELAKGRTIDEIRADRAAMTRQIYDMWVEVERGLGAAEVLFLDRGLPDSFTFFRVAGMDPNAIVSDCLQHRYASVFMLDRLPYLRDGVRAGDDETAAYFDAWMERDYSALGYKVIRVPVLPPEDRLAFVLARLSERGLMGQGGGAN